MIAMISAETFALSSRLARLARPFSGTIKAAATWRARARGRRHLADLDVRMLRDIGITRMDVERECHKPFWQI